MHVFVYTHLTNFFIGLSAADTSEASETVAMGPSVGKLAVAL